MGPLFEIIVGKNDAARDESDVKITTVAPGVEVRVGEPSVILDQGSITINRIDKLVKETRIGVVVAILATFSTAIAICLEPWIGLFGVIIVIILIGAFVAVILRHAGLLRRS